VDMCKQIYTKYVITKTIWRFRFRVDLPIIFITLGTISESSTYFLNREFKKYIQDDSG
jgi:hypothetical protein